jgi:multiple sugar transport system permease protein
VYLMYEEGFRWWNLGTASAVAFLLFLLMIAVTQGLLRLGRRGEELAA